MQIHSIFSHEQNDEAQFVTLSLMALDVVNMLTSKRIAFLFKYMWRRHANHALNFRENCHQFQLQLLLPRFRCKILSLSLF